MRLLVVSDLHIFGPEDPLYGSVLEFLRRKVEPGDTVVFAGDIFDLFIGNKLVFVSRYSEFLDELEACAKRGVELHYIEGNHDFNIRKAFKRVPGIKIHLNDVKLEMDGRRFFVAHGDMVDPTDYGYALLRGLFRSPLMKAFVKVMPGRWIDRIGRMSSDTSRQRKPIIPSEAPRDGKKMSRLEEVRKLYRSYAAERLAEGYDFVVLGHCHDLDEMSFTVGGRRGQYVNVGYPRVHGSFLSWSPSEELISREPF